MVDRKSSKLASLVNAGLVLLTALVTLGYLSNPAFTWYIFFMSFLWGVQDGSVNTHCLEMLGFEFDDNTEPFSIFSMFEAVAVFIFQLVQAGVDSDPANKRYDYGTYIGITGVLGTLMCGCTYYFDFKEKLGVKGEARRGGVAADENSSETDIT